MTEKKQLCEKCNEDISISFIRLQQLIDHSYHLKIQNNKLLEFVKSLRERSCCNVCECIVCDTTKFLRSIGEG